MTVKQDQEIPHKCHFIGIGGIGMSGLARLLLSQHVEVSGSDVASSYVTEGLIQSGAKVYQGHSAHHVSSEMTVIYSSDIKEENPEYQAAISLQCPILHRSDLLERMMAKRKSLAVAGTHGKTTTTSLLASVLLSASLKPSYMIGGILAASKLNSAFGEGEYFVAEADESDGTFLKYNPFGAIVTNIDDDHMNFFKTEERLIHAFKAFMTRVSSPQHLFWCGDDPRLHALHMPGISYGFNDECLLRGSHYIQKDWNISFDVSFQGKHFHHVEVALTGKHNALNALAVFGLAIQLGIPESTIRAAFQEFKGVGRRCEKKGDVQGILLLDDYAHHPTEISATLTAVRSAVQERRLIAVFQPHRYTRMQYCIGNFGSVFETADEVIITDLYAAGEAPIDGVSTEKIVQEIQQSHPTCRYISRKNLTAYLQEKLRPHDVMISLGAGDITKLGSDLLHQFSTNPPAKLKVGVICGGQSYEHEISLLSVEHVFSSLKKEFYDVVPFGITKQGRWIHSDDVVASLMKISKEEEAIPQEVLSSEILQKIMECDLLFPMLHGTNGEDGTFQGFCEILGKPYTGPDYRSAAITMDKALTKKLMLMHDIATSPFVDFTFHQWRTQKENLLKTIHQCLHFPLYVKPLHLGSTVGISRVENEEQLLKAVENAFKVDQDVLVENEMIGRELEFAVLGTDNLEVFPPGEIFTDGMTYDYDAKYGPQGMQCSSSANLDEHLVKKGINFAFKAYRAAGCHGMARVDCFLDREGKYWLNEINPIPGFTKTSLYPKMCEVNGVSSSELMDKLVILALYHHRAKLKVSG